MRSQPGFVGWPGGDEATGRYHCEAHTYLHKAGIPVAAINPYRTRRFSEVLGRLAKTDEIDAEVLAEFAAIMRPAPSEPPSDTMARIDEITVARRQVVDERLALENQRSQARLDLVTDQLDWRIALCRRVSARSSTPNCSRPFGQSR